MQRELKEGVVGYYKRNFLSLKNSASKVFGHQVVIIEVLVMVGKLLKNILPDKKENRKAEVHKQALDLSPGYSDCKIAILCIMNIFEKLL
ncbi:MAG: hypothetical protein U9P81_10280 [Euryarchaeota archaeon]|nr:hypothetical protein [Euryarchaeota archaeon]